MTDGIGHEASGVVTRVGAIVEHVKVGDRVIVFGRGCFTTRLVAHGNHVARIPDDLGFEDAATMPLVYVTAIHSLVNLGQLARGQVRSLQNMYEGGIVDKSRILVGFNTVSLWRCWPGCFANMPDAWCRGITLANSDVDACFNSANNTSLGICNRQFRGKDSILGGHILLSARKNLPFSKYLLPGQPHDGHFGARGRHCSQLTIRGTPPRLMGVRS